MDDDAIQVICACSEQRKGGKGIEHLTAKQRHRLRIALKQLRYDTNSLSGLYTEKKVKPYVDALCELQDVLGNLNDLVVARKLLCVVNNLYCAAVDKELKAARAKRLKALAPAWQAFRAIPDFWKRPNAEGELSIPNDGMEGVCRGLVGTKLAGV